MNSYCETDNQSRERAREKQEQDQHFCTDRTGFTHRHSLVVPFPSFSSSIRMSVSFLPPTASFPTNPSSSLLYCSTVPLPPRPIQPHFTGTTKLNAGKSRNSPFAKILPKQRVLAVDGFLVESVDVRKKKPLGAADWHDTVGGQVFTVTRTSLTSENDCPG